VEELLTKQNLNIMNKLTEKDKQFVFDIEKEVNFSITNPTNIKLYTEEDMIKCVVAHAKYTDSLRNGRPNFSMWISSHQGKSFLQSLQQPKRPKYFECQMSPMNLDEIRENGKGFLHTNTNKMVVITNSQGQTELVGEYSYE